MHMSVYLEEIDLLRWSLSYVYVCYFLMASTKRVVVI